VLRAVWALERAGDLAALLGGLVVEKAPTNP
jgi:hypothetical protein